MDTQQRCLWIVSASQIIANFVRWLTIVLIWKEEPLEDSKILRDVAKYKQNSSYAQYFYNK